MLLCERLIAFRTSSGEVGLLEEACPHRGASLFFGRNEGSGLRCAYHGWKFDVSGRCLEMPNEIADNALREKVQARAYPCVERGGIVWAYLGGRPVPPPLPDLEPNQNDMHGAADANLVENNWLQSLEGDIDIAHVPILHADNIEGLSNALNAGSSMPTSKTNSAPPVGRPDRSTNVMPLARHIEVADTPAGFAFAATVPQASVGLPPGWSSRTMWSVGHFLFPFYANLPYAALGSYWVVARVPMDDFRTMTFGMWHKDAPRPAPALMFGSSPAFRPNTADWFGRFRLTRDPLNDFMLDRDRARAGGVGVSGQSVQDSAITASMGPVVDRTREHLGKSDIAIVHLRRRLLAALDVQEEGTAPAVDSPGAYRVKHGTFQVADGIPWSEELRRRGGAGSTAMQS